MGRYTVNTAGKSPGDKAGQSASEMSTAELRSTNITVMGKPAIVQLNVSPPLAASAPVLAAPAPDPSMALKFPLQRDASIDAGKGLLNVAVSSFEPKWSGGTLGMPANS